MSYVFRWWKVFLMADSHFVDSVLVVFLKFKVAKGQVYTSPLNVLFRQLMHMLWRHDRVTVFSSRSLQMTHPNVSPMYSYLDFLSPLKSRQAFHKLTFCLSSLMKTFISLSGTNFASLIFLGGIFFIWSLALGLVSLFDVDVGELWCTQFPRSQTRIISPEQVAPDKKSWLTFLWPVLDHLVKTITMISFSRSVLSVFLHLGRPNNTDWLALLPDFNFSPLNFVNGGIVVPGKRQI